MNVELQRLRQALLDYGEHTDGCKSKFTKDHDDCDCGWKAILKTLDA